MTDTNLLKKALIDLYLNIKLRKQNKVTKL